MLTTTLPKVPEVFESLMKVKNQIRFIFVLVNNVKIRYQVQEYTLCFVLYVCVKHKNLSVSISILFLLSSKLIHKDVPNCYQLSTIDYYTIYIFFQYFNTK